MITLNRNMIVDEVDSEHIVTTIEDFIKYMYVMANQVHGTVQMRWQDAYLISVGPGVKLEKLIEDVLAGWEMAKIRRRGW